MTKMSDEEKKRAQLAQKYAKVTGDILSVYDIVGSDSQRYHHRGRFEYSRRHECRPRGQSTSAGRCS